MQPGGSYNEVSDKRVNDNTRDTTFMKDGRQVAEHMIVSDDGKTMTVTVRALMRTASPWRTSWSSTRNKSRLPESLTYGSLSRHI